MEKKDEDLTLGWRRHVIKEEIAQNEAAVESTKIHLQALETHRHELLEALNSTSRIMTALSSEVLSEIFILACQHADGAYSTPTQFRIGRVCRAWRRIAWSTPRLWRKMNIRFAKNRYETQRILLEDWIKRSGDCPLDLWLRNYDNKWELPFDSTLQFLMTTRHRWRKLEIIDYPNFGLALGQNRASFPLLEELRIYRSGLTTDRHLPNWNFYSATPRLRLLDLSIHFWSPKLAVDSSNLVELWMSLSFRLLPCFDTLASAPSLKQLHCRLEGYNPDFDASTVPVPYLPLLSSLSVEGHSKLLVSFLELLTLPNLRKLFVTCTKASSQASWTAAIAQLVGRSACRLIHLSIEQDNLVDEEPLLESLRKLSPALEELHLECPNTFILSDRFIKSMDLSLAENASRMQDCLPNLVSFVYQGGVSVKLRTLLSMLDSRRRSKRQAELAEGDREEEVDANDGSSIADSDEGSTLSSTTTDFGVSDHNTGHHLPNQFRTSIYYLNLSWYQNIKPDKMQKFLSKVADFAQDGVTLNLNWQRQHDDDSSVWSSDE